MTQTVKLSGCLIRFRTAASAAARERIAIACVVMMIGAVGCSSGNPYAPPSLPASEVATLKGIGSTFVREIDGKEVQGGYTIAYVGSGNQTTVAPGQHRVGIYKQIGTGSKTYPVLLDAA